ncbi:MULTISPECIES: hypothetical protein [unclassified Mucilaginibacter]|uniref:hypothetical protein n=1 Tax=unclassified Mucilaginibacter TaxID=2617802 RepID=UPI00096396EC|nr:MULTISPECIES: hypothetical protein [unclassified Mucilaginibacter]OJW12601.1 MAG: hypothetical protein BGO48_05830 [Mucilaginibacter sp. 44-25]PLW88450.1 MAG: hypothetical protein C0154_16595 [Mucilaginibacter sp.]HEK19073.1 hypothetical protein [Bacteroidota bacterium]
MSHHHHPHHQEDKNYDYIYYLVALVCGLFVGAVIEKGFIWIPVGGVFGLLTAAVFLKFLVRGREEV